MKMTPRTKEFISKWITALIKKGVLREHALRTAFAKAMAAGMRVSPMPHCPTCGTCCKPGSGRAATSRDRGEE
jgi:uncharacterized protein (DUF2062 family)